ncbi:MAG: hypothetical protein EOO77_22830, partial [Oxalobacteraceae bacterium]
MGARLSDAERAERKKARAKLSFSDASYRHYNPALEGFGSIDEWMRKADAILTGKGILKAFDRADTQMSRDLATLNLDALPGDAAGLKRAFRNTAMFTHPDKGGTTEAFREVVAAFERLGKH